MTTAKTTFEEMTEVAQDLRERQEPFAFATIVRTAGATAAKPGAKALLSCDGTILQGWLGGGCTRGAVKRAAIKALKDGAPQLVSVAPEDLLAEKGIMAGDQMEGTTFASNGCPSRGSVDIFIEPCLPMAQLMVLGCSPVAQSLKVLAPQFHWLVQESTSEQANDQQKFIVVATQGNRDLDALKSAIACDPFYLAFVGSRRKYGALAEELANAGIEKSKINQIHTPAGLDIGAVTPEEIALSVLAELVQQRRSKLNQNND